MVKVQRGRRIEPAAPNRRVQDICGLLVFFLGAASLLSLSLPHSEAIPRLTNEFLRQLAGQGAYAIPLLLLFAGTMFLVGFERFSLSYASYGTLLLFLIYVTWRHLHLLSSVSPLSVGALNPLVNGAGGWIGWLFGAPLHFLAGPTIGYMFLGTLTLVAVVLIVDRPFVELVRIVADRGKAGAQAAGRAVSRRMPVAPAPLPANAGKAAIPANGARAIAATANGSLPEHNERTARVVERALRPPGRAVQTALDLPEADPQEALSATARIRRMFGLTRSWRRGIADDDDDAGAGAAEDEDDTPTVATPEPPAAEPEAAPRAARPERKPRAAAAPAGDSEAAPAGPDPVFTPAQAAPAPRLFALPPLTLLKATPPAVSKRSQAELTDRVRTIERTLEQFNIGANVVEVASGPSVTRYEVQLAPGIKVSKIVSLADNLAMSLAAIDVRVEAPIPGKSAIGVEVPNSTPVTVSLRECLEADEYRNAPSRLTVALGKDVSGLYRVADLTRMPHLLIGGSTNSGKSVCLNCLIASLVYRATPREVQLLMIDPKRVELSLWDGIPHLMHPVVKDVKQAAGVFRAAIKEMDRRYDLFAALGTRNLEGYNLKVAEDDKLPFIVLIVDELADLMIQQGPEVETSICRLAQLARATGIHLIIATQRPSVDIITGTIKANISSRIAFAVASQVDSRTILDMTGADRLIGRGDMLFLPIDASKPVRIQGCYLSEQETNALVTYLKEQEKPQYNFAVAETGGSESGGRMPGQTDDEDDDAFFEQAVRLVVNNGQASTSMLQRRFRIGYTRAARIVEMMEEKGIVGALNGAKPREILVSRDEVERMFNPGGPIPSVAAYRDTE